MVYLRLFRSIITHPARTLNRVKTDANKLRFGLLSLLIHSGFAMGKQMFFHLQAVPAEPAPWLRIPEESAWLVSFALNLPVDVLQAVLFAGVVSLAAKLFRGRGSFEGQFALYAVAFTPVNILLIVGTLCLSILGHARSPIWMAYFILVLAWDLGMIVLSVRIEQNLAWAPALFTSAVGFVPAVLFSLTYIR